MSSDLLLQRFAVIGPGRLGTALSAALTGAGLHTCGPLGRGADAAGSDVVVLAVPDGEIVSAAAALIGGPDVLVGHCSGATTLDALAPHEAFSLHPLMTVPAPAEDAAATASAFLDAYAAVAGATPCALATATSLATAIGLRPIEVADADRAVYHAAASIASNFLVTLEGAAERLAATAGVDRDALVPLVRASVENWAALGADRALTGPIARGDEATVARQRAAVQDRCPDLLELFDALTAATRDLAGARA